MPEPPSSPRRRGSAAASGLALGPVDLLPAQAGVSRGWRARRRWRCPPPRAGGGQPWVSNPHFPSAFSSPRRRGSAEDHRAARPEAALLPAQAGVSRCPCGHFLVNQAPPRAGGGQPQLDQMVDPQLHSSPRRRGSAGGQLEAGPDGELLPAQAGVSRPSATPAHRSAAPPRAGGVSRSPGGPSPRGLAPPRAGGGQPYRCRPWCGVVTSSPRRRGSAGGGGSVRSTFGPPPRAGGGQPPGQRPPPRRRNSSTSRDRPPPATSHTSDPTASRARSYNHTADRPDHAAHAVPRASPSLGPGDPESKIRRLVGRGGRACGRVREARQNQSGRTRSRRRTAWKITIRS